VTVRRLAKRVVISAALLVGLMAAGAGGFVAYLRITGNIGVVEPGVFYRSGQLSESQIEQVVVKDGIRSILNLRGANPGTPWYDAEVAESKAKHVVHYDYRLSAEHFVTPEQSDTLLLIIKNAPKPILVHCQAGSDRTGLVSALYRFDHGASADQARRELTLRYGHFPYLWSGTKAMDESFDAYLRREPRK
jgi:protein tyrosine/serine phosphatase